MKINLSVLLALPLLLIGLSSCNPIDPVEESAAGIQLQQSVAADPNLCIECQQGCILGYDYSPIDMNGQNPGGGYMVSVIVGNCTCHQDNGGTWYVVGNGNTTSTQVGGQPGTNMLVINTVMNLWNFNCYPNTGGNGGPHTWGNWVDAVNDLEPATPISVNEWPGSWGVAVKPATAPGHVTVALDGEDQVNLLNRIRIFTSGTSTALIDITSNGANEYDLDLSSLANGMYTVALEYEPGFVLQKPLAKY